MSSTIQIPMIFDVSANGVVYGEDISDNVLIQSHINFVINQPNSVDASACSNFRDAMKKILYSDTPEDQSGVLFYVDQSGVDGVSTSLGDAVKGLLLNGQLLSHDGTTESEMFGGHTVGGTTKYGIPIGFKQSAKHEEAGATSDAAVWYKDSFIDSPGAELYRLLIRVASTHLMGHPFAQAFIQENTVERDLSNTNFANQIKTQLLADLSSATVGEAIAYTEGKKVAVLQTIYEQLLRVNLAEHSAEDDSSGNSDLSGIPRPLVFKNSNTITFFIRPRMFFALDISGGISELNQAVGNAIGISGTSAINTTGSADAAAVFNDIFKVTGGSAASGFHWLVGKTDGNGAYHKGNVDSNGDADLSLNQYGTNLTWTDAANDLPSGSDAVAMLDAHVWKVKITLTGM